MILKNRFSELFPTVETFAIFTSYIVLFAIGGVMVKASYIKGYNYSSVGVVLLTEAVKLVLAFLCYIREHTLNSLYHGIRNNLKILCIYMVPCFLYCIYNNLYYISLSHFDPTTYFILLQIRIVITGVIYQILFQKRLTKMQWFSLVLLTMGCMVQQIDWDLIKSFLFNEETTSKNQSFSSIYLFYILIQTLCSCFAGVFTEYLIKKPGEDVNLFIQNIFFYFDSIILNLIVLGLQENYSTGFSADSLWQIFQPLVLMITFVNAVQGITTSLFLSGLNSVIKTFASAIELILISFLSWLVLGLEVTWSTIFAMGIIFISLYIYSKNPVSTKKNTVKTKKEDEVLLIQEV